MENAVVSIDSLDVIIGEIINDSLSMVQLYSIDDKSKSTAIYNGGISIVRASSVGALFTSVAFAINLPPSLGISVTAAVVAAAVLGVIVGIVAMVMFIRHCSQAIAKYEHLKEKYSCVSKSAIKVQELIPELKTTIERMVDMIKKWSQEEVVKNELEELRSACEKQHPQLVITQKHLAEL